MNPSGDVVVAIPAHNEQDGIARCLDALEASAGHALTTGVAGRVLIAVAAHRCTDRTAEEALVSFSRCQSSFLLAVDNQSATVGEVRARLLEQLSIRGYVDDQTWVLNTDAGSQVPLTWITDILHRAAAPDHPDAIAGLVELSDG